MLSAADVTFRYPRAARPAVDAVTVRVPRGGAIGILGPNGSGKTTLLKLLCGTLAPTAGRVTFDGEPLERLPRRAVARRIAMVPQETHLTFEYTALEIALMGRHPHLGAFALEGPADVAAARAALAATDTERLADRLLATLSGGERQRVIIASALAQEPDVLLLDEPTASLDLGYQLEVAAILGRLNAERGTTVVLSTHDLNFAASICRDLLLVRDGRVLASGPTDRALTADTVRRLFDVDADVSFHDRAGHLVVTPLSTAH